ncbi:ribonuclease H-like domain-containing protein [Hygrophoropsis aurantiaca]|uniref:Ribonuclease H-like domain-containing protein n=1 Tax=Hygrophoropsis aurantiaca TaxID=72124 RepID=A0ACB8A5L9_9AGAM|nr:ribonuclease H-like domain-containing protein [Hygrophoropsis aurantiaca]
MGRKKIIWGKADGGTRQRERRLESVLGHKLGGELQRLRVSRSHTQAATFSTSTMSDTSRDRSKAMESPLPQPESLVRTRTERDLAPESEPASKQQKLPPGQSFVDVLADMNEEGGPESWPRPVFNEDQFKERKNSISFQQIEIEEVDGGSIGALRMYGVTEEGHSVLAHVSGFLPYLYIAVPRDFHKVDIGVFAGYLNRQVKEQYVSEVEQVFKRTLWGYQDENWKPFLKITIVGPKYLALIRDIFESGQCTFRDLFPKPVATFESNVPYPLRFMADTKMAGMSWVEIPAQQYTIRREADRNKISTCQIELDVRYDSLISHPVTIEGRWSKIAPLRILSFDIECMVPPACLHDFSKPHREAVIQIASVVTLHGEQEPLIRNVFALNDCLPIGGAQILSFVEEYDMLQAWRDFLEEVDPDIIMGFNIVRFDMPYLLDRARHLGIPRFPFFGRLRDQPTPIKNVVFTSRRKPFSPTASFQPEEPFRAAVPQGRLQFDVMQFVEREYQMGYSLNNVSKTFLGEQKEDVHFTQITELQNGTAETRHQLAVYCLKDAYLPQKISQNLKAVDNYIAMSRVAGVPFSYLFSRGQSVRSFSQILRKAGEKGYILPAFGREDSDTPYEDCYDQLEAHIKDHTAMLSKHNLCYVTLLDQATIARLDMVKDVDYIQTRNGPDCDFFVKSKRRRGIIPILLEDLISARVQVDADLQTETADSARGVMLKAHQRALGIIVQSFYMYTQSKIGKLSCPAISRSAKAFYRQDSEVDDRVSAMNVVSFL